MRDRLAELYAKAKQNALGKEFTCTRERNMFVVDFLIANGVTVQEWISVKDRLPDEDGEYLVFERIWSQGFARVLRFVKDPRKVDRYDFDDGMENVWYDYDSEWGYYTVDDVTHWMPLPQQPKGVGDTK